MRTITLLFYVAPALFLALGCAPDAGTTDPTRADGLELLPESARLAAWSTPGNLGSINLPTATDQHPTLSKDGLSLYFASNRQTGDQNIWVAQRACADPAIPACAWGVPEMLDAPVNSSSLDVAPALSRDEHWLFFTSQRGGDAPRWEGDLCTSAPCDRDLWVSYRRDVHELAWEPPVNLGAPLNSNAEEVAPSYFENEESGLPQLFFNDGVLNASGVLVLGNIFVSEMLPDGKWGERSPVSDVNPDEVNTSCSDQRPSISYDGLELYFHSTRPCPNGVPGVAHVWVSTRQRVGDAWPAPTLWPNPTSNEPAIHPFIHSHGKTETLLFVRGGDILMSQRTFGASGSD